MIIEIASVVSQYIIILFFSYILLNPFSRSHAPRGNAGSGRSAFGAPPTTLAFPRERGNEQKCSGVHRVA